jgi:hypothetical protein
MDHVRSSQSVSVSQCPGRKYVKCSNLQPRRFNQGTDSREVTRKAQAGLGKQQENQAFTVSTPAGRHLPPGRETVDVPHQDRGGGAEEEAAASKPVTPPVPPAALGPKQAQAGNAPLAAFFAWWLHATNKPIARMLPGV